MLACMSRWPDGCPSGTADALQLIGIVCDWRRICYQMFFYTKFITLKIKLPDIPSNLVSFSKL